MDVIHLSRGISPLRSGINPHFGRNDIINQTNTIVISSEVEKSPTVETVRRIPAPAHLPAVALFLTAGGFSLRSHKISFSCHTTGEERI